MRIDAYNQISQIYAANRTQKVNQTSRVSGAKDEFKLSSKGRDMQIANQAVAESSGVREDKVAAIKQQMDSGKYQVDTGDFASLLMSKFNSAI